MSLEREELRSLCDSSLYDFTKIIGGYVQQGADISPVIHRAHADFVDDPMCFRSGNLMPRIWRKSTMLTKWRIIRNYLLNPSVRQLLVSENILLGGRMMTFIKRQLMVNRLLRWIYEDKLGHLNQEWLGRKLKSGMKPRWGSTQIDLPKEDWYSEASVTVVGVLGAAQSGHYDIIMCDDIIGKKAMESKLVMEGVYRWLDNCPDLLVQPYVDRPNPSTISITGTHWAPGDAYCYMQEKMPDFNWLITPALKDSSLADTPNIHYVQLPDAVDDECNYPEVYSTQYYHDMRNDPEKAMIFWCQQQNNPAKAVAMTKFDVSWLRYYKLEKRNGETYVVCLDDGQAIPVGELQRIGMIDPGGFSEKEVTKRSSRNAMIIGGKVRGGKKKFLLYVYAQKLRTPKDYLEELFRANEEWRPQHWRIETVAAQEWIYRDIVQKKNDLGLSGKFSIIPLDSQVTRDVKDDDILSLIGPGSRGEIYITQSMQNFRTEWQYYPIGLTVDLMDLMGKLNRQYWQFGDSADTEKLNIQSKNRWMSKAGPIWRN